MTRSVQVAQLLQRDRAKIDTFSHNHAQNCIFGPHYVGIRDNISALSESFNAKELCIAEFHCKNASFTRKTANF